MPTFSQSSELLTPHSLPQVQSQNLEVPVPLALSSSSPELLSPQKTRLHPLELDIGDWPHFPPPHDDCEKVKIESVKHDWPHVRGPHMNSFTDVSEGNGKYMVVFVSEDQHVYAYNLTGDRLWSTPIDEEFGIWISDPYPPAVVDNTMYFSTKEGKIYALDFNGDIKWSKKIKNSGYWSPTSVVIKKDIMAFGQSNDAYLTDLNGNLIWKSSDKGSGHIPPVISDDFPIISLFLISPLKSRPCLTTSLLSGR